MVMEISNPGGARPAAAGQQAFSPKLPSAPRSIIIESRGGTEFSLDVSRPEAFLDISEITHSSGPLNLTAQTDGLAVIYAYLVGIGISPPWGSHGRYTHRPAEVPYGHAEGQSEIIHVLYERTDPNIGKLFYQGRFVPGSISLLGVESSRGEYLPIALALPNHEKPMLTHYVSFMALYADHPDVRKVLQAGIELGVHEFTNRDEFYAFFNLTRSWVNVEGCAPFMHLHSPGLYAPTTPVTWALLGVAGEYVKKNDVVLDMGTGSGIMAVSLTKRSGCRVDGVDYNPRAVLAARSAALLTDTTKLTRFWESDVFDSVRGKYDVIVSYPVVDDSISAVMPGIQNDPNRFDTNGTFDRKFYSELPHFLKPGPRSRVFLGACDEVIAKLPRQLKVLKEHPALKEEKVLEIGWAHA